MKIVYTHEHHQHTTQPPIPGYGRRYPEVPDRIESIRSHLLPFSDYQWISPRDYGRGVIDAVHSPVLVDHLMTAFAQSRSDPNDRTPLIPDTFAVQSRRPHSSSRAAATGSLAFDVSCPIFEKTWQASYWATQSAVTAAEEVALTKQPVYALIRPPGHHAGPGFHGGFCYTNHAAAAARHLQKRSGSRVAVLDIDYHHGNGTQEIFAADESVYFASLHADPHFEYPYYWGFADDIPGEFNRNVPLPFGTRDSEYLSALKPVLDEINRFSPHYLVLSAGFDLMAGDPVAQQGGFAITPDGLASVGRAICELGIPTVIVQEGGYNLPRLGSYAEVLLQAFSK